MHVKSSAVAEMGDRLATVDIWTEKCEVVVRLSVGGAPNVTKWRLRRGLPRDEGSYQLSHAYDRFLDATADRRIKTRKN